MVGVKPTAIIPNASCLPVTPHCGKIDDERGEKEARASYPRLSVEVIDKSLRFKGGTRKGRRGHQQRRKSPVQGHGAPRSICSPLPGTGRLPPAPRPPQMQSVEATFSSLSARQAGTGW